MEFCAYCYHPYSEHYLLHNGGPGEKICGCGCGTWKPIGAMVASQLNEMVHYLAKMMHPPSINHHGYNSAGAPTPPPPYGGYYYGTAEMEVGSYKDPTELNYDAFPELEKILSKETQTDEE